MASVQGSSIFDMEDGGADRCGHVVATWRTAPPGPEQVREALDYRCPDCNVSVFISEDEGVDGVYHIKIEHGPACKVAGRTEAGARDD